MQPNRKKLGFKDYAKATIPLAHSHTVKETPSDLLPNGFRIGQRICWVNAMGYPIYGNVVDHYQEWQGEDRSSVVWAIWEDSNGNTRWIPTKNIRCP